MSLTEEIRRRSRGLMRTPAVPRTGPHGDRLRVLLECAPERSPMVVAAILDRADCDVVVCEGPQGRERCPVAAGGRCPALDRADVVVNLLGAGTPARAEVLAAAVASGTPARTVVAVADGDASTPGVRTLSPYASAEQLVAAVRSASLRQVSPPEGADPTAGRGCRPGG